MIKTVRMFLFFSAMLLVFPLMNLSYAAPQGESMSKRVLIVYLSRTHNTQAVAEMIHQHVGGDIVALELVTPYPSNYRQTVEQVQREDEAGFRPVLKTKIEDMVNYDVVFVGFPTWGMQLPPPIRSFFHDYDLSGKQVIPFNTHAGYGVGKSFNQVNQLCKGCRVEKGIAFVGGYERNGKMLDIKDKRALDVKVQLDDWLNQLGFTTN
jgi:flavodoxin